MTLPTGALGPRLGSGRGAEVFLYGDAAVLKRYRPGFGGHRTEAQALRSLDGHDVAPKLIDVVDCDGRVGLVVERVAGVDMLTLLQRQPWRVRRCAHQLARAHRAIHGLPAPAGLADLREVLASRIRDAGLRQVLLGQVLGLLDGLPDGDRLCHGDYHPGNLLVTPDRAAVIDWGSAARGAPEADHARTLLLLRWSQTLPGTPLLSRAVIATGRSLLAGAYERAYRRASAPSPRTDAWLIVQAAARLSEGIDTERPMLMTRLERALGKASV